MRVVMFGLGQLSSLAWYCLTHDSPHEIVAFTVDGAYMDRAEFEGLPVVAFEDVENRFPPGDYAMLVPIGAPGRSVLGQLGGTPLCCEPAFIKVKDAHTGIH